MLPDLIWLDILERIHPQRLLSHETPLTQECRRQSVTEEALTLFRDVMRCLPLVLWPVVSWPGSFRAGIEDVVGRT
jgi:hypothetical protein